MAHRLADEFSSRTVHIDKLGDEETLREAAFRRLETLGYRVGQGLVER